MKIKVALISKWHVHAVEYFERVQNNKLAQIVAVWDEDRARGQAWADEIGVPFYENYDELLTQDIDAISVCAPTSMHENLIIKAAKAKKHIFTEKVLATTVSACKNIADAINEAGVKFCISFPRQGIREITKLKQLADSGVFGKLSHARIRISHEGAVKDWLPQYFYDKQLCGGGSMIDLGVHGLYLLRLFLGEPEKINAEFSDITGRGVDDSATIMIKFKGGAIGINETGFATQPRFFVVELYGTKGSAVFDGEAKSLKASFNGEPYSAITDLPQEKLHPIDQWLGAIKDETPIDYGLEEALHLTQIIEESYKNQ